MRAQVEKPKDTKSQSAAGPVPQGHGDDAGVFQFVDNRPEAIAQRKLQAIANSSQLSKQTTQLQQSIQKEGNNTGIPPQFQVPSRPVIEIGPPTLPILPCGHRDAGVVQRIITVLPPSKPDIEALEVYVFGTSINKRKQTFEQAATAEEYSARLFRLLQGDLDKKDTARALDRINQIIESVNKSETAAPHHPNPVSRSKEHAVKLATERESPYTISKTSESVELADKAKKLIMASAIAEKPLLFMLGVLVLPDGKLIVALSGNRSDLIAPLTELLLKAKFSLFGGTVYDVQAISKKDNKTYRKTAVAAVSSDKTGLFDFDKGRIVRTTVQERDDLGSFPATCAAAVALSVAKSVDPSAFAAGGRMGLTEVLVSTNSKSQVTIYNKETGDGEKFGLGHNDVPSCHVCQMQLESVAQEVIALERKGIVQQLELAIDKQSSQIEDLNKTLKDLYTNLNKEKDVQSKSELLIKYLQELDVSQTMLDKKREAILADIKVLKEAYDPVLKELDLLDRKIEASFKNTAGIAAEQDKLKDLQKQKRQIESTVATLQSTIKTLQADQTTLDDKSKWTHAPYYAEWYAHLKTMQNRKEKTFSSSTKDSIATDLTQDLALQQANLQKEQLGLAGKSSADIQIEINKLQDKRSAEHEAREKFKGRKRELAPTTEEFHRKNIEKDKEIKAIEEKKELLKQSMEQVKQKLKETEQAGIAANFIEKKIEKIKDQITQTAIQLDRNKMSLKVYLL